MRDDAHAQNLSKLEQPCTLDVTAVLKSKPTHRVRDRAWRADKTVAGGGVVLDGGSHTLRPMRMLMKPHCGEVSTVTGVTKALEPAREGESYTRTLLRFEHGQTATLEMGAAPEAALGPAPWIHRVVGTVGELRVVSSTALLLYNSKHRDGKLVEVADDKITHGLLLQDFASAVLHNTYIGVEAGDSLGESLTALAIYRSNESGKSEVVFTKEYFDAAEKATAKL
eukprot:SAG31_NODE_983_length_10554_cov_6.049259_3_plen_225_part_00